MTFIGKILDGRYRLHERIGDGGFGFVYLAQDTRFTGNNFVAVKQIPQNSEHHNASFRREADLLYNLSHPNLPKVYDCFQEEGSSYIVLDYISGEDLSVSLKKGRVFSVAEVFQIADKVLSAIEYLHSHTIFHRDIKPHNIKIDEKGHIFLLDFGTAKGNFDESTIVKQNEQSIVGYTPFYAPLEQVLRIDPNSYLILHSLDSEKLERFLDMKTDARSDIYSLGITLYQLLTRISPEKAASTTRAFAVWSGKPDLIEPIQNFNPEVPEIFGEIINKSIELEPENRFQTATEFRQALQNFQNRFYTSNISVFPETNRNLIQNVETDKTVNVFANKSSNLPEAEKVEKQAVSERKSKTPLLIGVFGLALFLILSFAILGFLLKSTYTNANSRNLTYSLLVQKMRDGKEYQEPFESSGQEVFEKGYLFTMNLMPSENGYLYIFAEGLNENNQKDLNIIFPTPKQNNGSANVSANQKYHTGWNEFGGGVGTENFWLVWIKERNETLETARENAFNNEGVIADKSIESQLSTFFEKQKIQKTALKDIGKKQSKIDFDGDSAVYLIQLEHR